MRPRDAVSRYAALPAMERRLACRAAVLLVLARLTLRWARPGQGLRWWRRVPPLAPVSSSLAPERVAWLVEAVASRLPFTTTCLARAAVSARLIAGTGHSCDLVIGTDHAGPDFAAHAWVVAGAGVVAGPAPEPRFQPVARWTLPTR